MAKSDYPRVIERVESNKTEFLDKFIQYGGNIGLTCKAVGVCRKTYYNWLDNDPEFGEQVKHMREELKDNVESKLMELINGVTVQEINPLTGEENVYTKIPCKTSIIFFLKTQCKDRGYVERQELSGNNGADLFKSAVHFDFGGEVIQPIDEQEDDEKG